MAERIIISPSELTEDEIRALEEFLKEKRESIFHRWPEKNLRDIEDFIQDYREGRDRLEEQFLRENPDMTPEDWRDHLNKPHQPQEYELKELDIAEQTATMSVRSRSANPARISRIIPCRWNKKSPKSPLIPAQPAWSRWPRRPSTIPVVRPC